MTKPWFSFFCQHSPYSALVTLSNSLPKTVTSLNVKNCSLLLCSPNICTLWKMWSSWNATPCGPSTACFLGNITTRWPILLALRPLCPSHAHKHNSSPDQNHSSWDLTLWNQSLQGPLSHLWPLWYSTCRIQHYNCKNFFYSYRLRELQTQNISKNITCHYLLSLKQV